MKIPQTQNCGNSIEFPQRIPQSPSRGISMEIQQKMVDSPNRGISTGINGTVLRYVGQLSMIATQLGITCCR